MDIDEVDEELLSRFINGDVQISGEPVLHAREDELRVTLARDISHQRIARKLLEEHSPDLLSVYYEGTDIASHYFWKYRFPEEWEQMFPELPIDPDELTRYRDVINEYYRLVDEWMGELMQIAPEKTLFVALSDHGFMTGRRTKEGAGMARETVSGIHVRSNPPGVLIMSGHGVRKGAVVDRATILDLAPTMLAVMGAPVARDMDGKVLLSALEKDAFEHDLPASWVETFERPGEGAE
jgi:predicted AlkP superfamily phosphohydrolase/phosphomutase